MFLLRWIIYSAYETPFNIKENKTEVGEGGIGKWKMHSGNMLGKAAYEYRMALAELVSLILHHHFLWEQT